MSLKRNTIVLIRNAQPYDFGGGERFPTFVADILTNYSYRPIVVSKSDSVIKFAISHKVDVIKSPWWRNQNWSGWRVALFPFYIIWQLLLTVYYLLVFIKLQPLAIHIQSKDDFIAGTIAGKIVGANIIWTDHADLKHIWLNLGVWYKNPVGKLVYLASRLVNALVVVSRNEARLITANIPSDSVVWKKFELIHNGCSDSYDLVTHKKDDVFTFCIANRLVTDKGLGETIDAFNLLHAELPNTRLLILGDGPESEKFKGQAASNKAIFFLGHQANPYRAIATSDVFLQPTYHDAFSVVLVEASMLGMPIIATSIGGNVEIIFHEETGLLIPSKDTHALYAAMQRLYTDSELRNKLAVNARENYLKDFNFDKIISERYIPLYEGATPRGLQKEGLR